MSTSAEPGITPMNTVTPHVREVIRSAQQELTGLLQRRAEIARRMKAIKQMLPGLAALVGTSILEDGLFSSGVDREVASRRRGLTRACRSVLMEAQTPLRIGQGCEELRLRFPELAQRHKVLKASVTTVFHRLVGYGEARCSLDDEGLTVWEWIQERKTNVPQNGRPEQTGEPEAGFVSSTELAAAHD
ncbi:MAG: hypothetical protein WB562_11480 [Candidatus Sulfotelmatobacter sp.]